MKKIKQFACILTSLSLSFCLFGCNSDDKDSSIEETIAETTEAVTEELTTEFLTEETTENQYALDLTINLDDNVSYKVNSNWVRDDDGSINRFYLPNSWVMVISNISDTNFTYTASDLVTFAESLKSEGNINDYSLLKIDDVNAFVSNGKDTIEYTFITNGNIYTIMISSDIETQLKDQIIESIEIKEIDLEKETENSVPKEYSNALVKAKTYSDSLHMSKAAIYEQLTSEYGEGFSEDAANYAVENLKADYKNNALEKAKTYQDSMAMSKNAIYDQLISEYGEQFTEEEAQYAIDHLE